MVTRILRWSTCILPISMFLAFLQAAGVGASAIHFDQRSSSRTSLSTWTSSRDSHVSSNDIVSRGFSSHINTSALFTTEQTISIQVTACTLAAISLCCSLVVLYWFLRMRKQFRHKLIVILIIADVIRSLWLFIFPVVSLIKGPVNSSTSFCQASGYFTQTGIEGADFAILTIAVHTALQVFKPKLDRFNAEESGLFPYRHKVYVLCALIPAVLCSFAYIGAGGEGYVSTAVVCGLPIRPFWYRLAISWIPRYVILLIVAGLYIAIYIHVAAQFRVIGWLGNDASNASAEAARQTQTPISQTFSEANQLDGMDLEFASEPPSAGTDGCIDLVAESRYNKTYSNRAVVESIPSEKVSRNAKTAVDGKNHMSRDMQKRHSAAQRQLKYLFIYPICYFLIWLVPFVNHLTTYDNYLAQHPIFVLVILSFSCISSMGFVDSLIFSLREKPWRHIPDSDGTFWGSFHLFSFPSKEPKISLMTDSRTNERAELVFPQRTFSTDLYAGAEKSRENSTFIEPGKSDVDSRRSFELQRNLPLRLDLQRSMSLPT